jgi:micrococcal nuclease
MQILITMALIPVALFQPATLKRSQPVLVRSVVNGDTIEVATLGRVRLLGIDAPETGHGLTTAAPFGREARAKLESLVLNRWVRLEQEGVAVDVYNRHQAYVITDDGQFINAVLVREGLARVSARTALARLPELQRAESDAQSSRRGIWGGTPEIPPAGYTPSSRATRSPASKSQKPKRKKQP